MNINNLNKAFESRVRIGIMSSLIVNRELNFNALKDLLEITDGNLASHLKSLEESGYIEVKKSFIGRKTNTTYKLTSSGEDAFKYHLNTLEKIINNIK